jgi:hypothetical protein
VETKRKQEKEISNVVVLTKPFAPQKDRMDHAEAVNNYRQQEEVSISVLTRKPSHKDRVGQFGDGARRKCGEKQSD